MKILITGSYGMLGTDIISLLRNKIAASAPDEGLKIIKPPREKLDVTHKDEVLDFILENTPDIIINCAAFTDVDKCETEREMAFNVNALGPKYVAAAADKCGSRVIHISTDFVFDGNSNRPYVEEDRPNPLSEYGRTKLEGERNIQNHCSSYLIVRTSWLFGHHGTNFVEKMLELAGHKELSVVTDQKGSPTYTVDLARMLWVLIERGCEGIFHVANQGNCSRYEWAEYIFKTRGCKININPIDSSQYRRPAKVPLNSTLNCQKFISVTGMRVRSWQEALEEYLNKQEC